MTEDLFIILNNFYEKLLHNINENGDKLKNDSVLWTLVEINAKKAEKYLSASSYSTNYFPEESLNDLLQKDFLRPNKDISKQKEFVLTASGIWAVEKRKKNFTEESLLDFIQNKHFRFIVKDKPIDDKEKLALFVMLCIRNFSVDVPMDLSIAKFREGWLAIFKEAFEFLTEVRFINLPSFEDLIATKGSEHPIQNIMRHRNDLPIKSNHIFCNNGSSKYYLDLQKKEEIDYVRLKHVVNLVFPKIEDLSTAIYIGKFMVDIAKNKAKYVVTSYNFIDSSNDEIMKKTVKDIFIG